MRPPLNAESPEWCQLDEALDDANGDHVLARNVARFVDEELDLTNLYESYLGVGSKALPPDLLVKLVLFETARGRQSPSQWLASISDSVAARWLVFGLTPSKSSLYYFRDRIAPFVDDWNAQLLATAFEEGWTEASTVALDGTFIEANASVDKRLNKDELDKRVALLQDLLENPWSATPPLPGWVAATMAGRDRQLKQYLKAQEILEQRLQENEKRRWDKRKPEQEVKVNVVDCESVFGKDKQGAYRMIYNVQIVDDVATPFVLACQVEARASDSGMLNPMLDRMEEIAGRLPDQILVDAAYPSGAELHASEVQRGVEVLGPWNANAFTGKKKKHDPFDKDQFTYDHALDVYRCPEEKLLAYSGVKQVQSADGEQQPYRVYQASDDCLRCPHYGECTTSAKGRTVRRHQYEELIVNLKERMNSPEAKQAYKQRGVTVERVFADLKQHRNLRRFSGRGLSRVRCQMGVAMLAHNLRTLFALRAEAADDADDVNPGANAA